MFQLKVVCAPPPACESPQTLGAGGRRGGQGDVADGTTTSEVCLLASLHQWGKAGEARGHGVWGQIQAERHLPFRKSHSPPHLGDMAPHIAVVACQVGLESSVWQRCSTRAGSSPHSFRFEL